MSAVDLTPNPQTNPQQLPGQQVAGTLAAPAVTPAGPAAPQIPQVDTTPMFSTPAGQQLSPTMAFPAANPSQYTDSQYLADEAAMRYGVAKQYQDILAQLGYTDPTTGQTIQGSLATGANIKAASLQHDLEQERIANDQQMQNLGLTFSGTRGTELAKAQYPTVQAEGQLGLDTTNSISDQYRNAQDLMTQYNLQNNQLLAAAAQRQLAGIEANPGGAGGAGGAGGTVTPPDGGVVPPGGTTPVVPPPPQVLTGTAPVSGAGGVQIGSQFQYKPPVDPALIQYVHQAFSGAPAPAPVVAPAPPPANQQVGTTFSGGAVAMAEGAIVDQPTHALVGEKGPEVVIPLRKLQPRQQIRLLALAHEAGIYGEAIKQAALA